MPRELVDRIHADYLRLKSCSKVARLHNRTRQSIHELLRTHQRPRYQRRLKNGQDVIVYEGINFTRQRHGGFRAGNHMKIDGESLLHRRIYAAAHGPIPEHMEIIHVDGNKRNFDLSNLAMKRRAEEGRRVSGGNNQHTVTLAKQRVEKHEGWIRKQAQRWYARNPSVELEDLIQEGRLAILEAHERYEEREGVKFLTYADWYIRKRMQDFVFATKDIVRVKSRKWDVRINVESLDATLTSEGDRTLHELIAAPETEEQLSDDSDIMSLLAQAMGKLNPREQAILKARFMEERTCADIARDFGITGSRIQQIEASALRKLRNNQLLKRAA